MTDIEYYIIYGLLHDCKGMMFGWSEKTNNVQIVYVPRHRRFADGYMDCSMLGILEPEVIDLDKTPEELEHIAQSKKGYAFT